MMSLVLIILIVNAIVGLLEELCVLKFKYALLMNVFLGIMFSLAYFSYGINLNVAIGLIIGFVACGTYNLLDCFLIPYL